MPLEPEEPDDPLEPDVPSVPDVPSEGVTPFHTSPLLSITNEAPVKPRGKFSILILSLLVSICNGLIADEVIPIANESYIMASPSIVTKSFAFTVNIGIPLISLTVKMSPVKSLSTENNNPLSPITSNKLPVLPSMVNKLPSNVKLVLANAELTELPVAVNIL